MSRFFFSRILSHPHTGGTKVSVSDCEFIRVLHTGERGVSNASVKILNCGLAKEKRAMSCL